MSIIRKWRPPSLNSLVKYKKSKLRLKRCSDAGFYFRCSVWFVFYSYFFSFFLSSLFSFSIDIFLDRHSNSWDSRKGKSNPYFLQLPLAHEHSISLSRFLPLLLRDLHFICIFIDTIKLEILTLTFHSDIVRFELISNYHPFITKQTPFITK